MSTFTLFNMTQIDRTLATTVVVFDSRLVLLLVFMGVIALAGFLLLVYVKKRVVGDFESKQDGGTLFSDLRAMRDRGEISDDEYERTRAVIIAKTTGRDAEQVRLETIRKQGGLVAEPGYDLTGRPLPGTPASELGELDPERDSDNQP
jgi:uncharacterized membrane protein